jgi:hypothetical protein
VGVDNHQWILFKGFNGSGVQRTLLHITRGHSPTGISLKLDCLAD